MVLAEPNEQEKDILRSFATDLEVLSQPPMELARAIAPFCLKAKRDVFTSLMQKSQSDAAALLGRITAKALHTAKRNVVVAKAYIGEAPEAAVAGIRDYLISLEAHESQRGVSHNVSSHRSRAKAHLFRVLKLIEHNIAIDAMHATADGSEIMEWIFGKGGFYYPLAEQPELLGVAYIHMETRGIYARNVARIDQVNSRRVEQNIRRESEEFIKYLAQPATPATQKQSPSGPPPGTRLH